LSRNDGASAYVVARPNFVSHAVWIWNISGSMSGRARPGSAAASDFFAVAWGGLSSSRQF
jgi:hypothetical protein